MPKLLLFCCLLFSLQSFSQKAPRHKPRVNKKARYKHVETKGIYLSFNPHSILEPDQGAVGLGVGYRFNRRFEVFAEFDYLFQGFYDNSSDFSSEHFKNLKGYRAFSNVKYFYNKRRGFFTGLEFRFKRYSFNHKDNFENIQLADTLSQYPYKATHTLFGIAAFWGQRVNLTRNGKFEMELSIGIGVKERYIDWGIPAGYSKLKVRRPDAMPAPDPTVEGAVPYVPGVIKFIYHLRH
jgi:hypothetical protein